MKVAPCFRFLAPITPRPSSASKKSAYLRFYFAARNFSEASGVAPRFEGRRDDITRRVKELQSANSLSYPRLQKKGTTTTCAAFISRYAALQPEESRNSESVTLYGRIYSSRVASSKLVFLDIVQDGRKVQVLCNLKKIGCSPDAFKRFYQLVRRGDIISTSGSPYRSKTGELSISVIALPEILAPSLASLPTILDDKETRIKSRHADMLVNKRTADTLRLRSHIIHYVRNFLVRDNFLEVQTPILSDCADGAMARPFTTTATEFSQRALSLRIAPEIWLKRMVLGGMDRVFEIGPAFRNEGLDATHNPEFTTCEFYKAFADLEDLITMSEQMLSGLSRHVNTLVEEELTALDHLDSNTYNTPFQRIEFIPVLEEVMNRKLPDLSSPEASSQMMDLFADLSLSPPSSPTLPRLLDKLSATYLEPHCDSPTFITHHPECLGPLAKSFVDPRTQQRVSARVELFVQRREIANMYEEENSPFEQRRKFEQQAQWRDAENPARMDESYLEALEWGLPPTGGWGCGIDRLVMLFAGAPRIGDVLSFGNLRNVVGLGHDQKGP